MFETATSESVNPSGKVTTRHLEGTLIETAYVDHCTKALVQSVLDVTPRILQTVRGANWLLEMSGVSSTDAGAREPGFEILKQFSKYGGNQFAVVITNGILRLTVGTVARAAGLPIRMFDRRAGALEYLRTQGSERRAG